MSQVSGQVMLSLILSAIVEAGLVEPDPLVKKLLGEKSFGQRSPLMNRGTFVRTAFIDQLIQGYGNDIWIVSLGAGYDTRAFQ